MKWNFHADHPLGNTGVTQQTSLGCSEFAEYLEALDRGWTDESWGSTAPVTGRVVRGDGVSIQLPPDCLEDFKKFLLEDLFDVDFGFDLLPRSGSKYYEDRYEGPFGVSILARPYSKSNRGFFKCDFLGNASSHLALSDWRNLFLWIDAHSGYASMQHWDIDDFKREVTPSMMLAAVKQPGEKYRGGISKGIVGFRTYTYHESNSEMGIGECINFGKKGRKAGEKQYSCYDKNIESKGEFNCIRHELRLWRNKSKQLFKRLVEWAQYPEWEELWLEEIAGTILGSIDFLDVSNYNPEEGKLSDCPRLQWWEDFISGKSIIKLGAKKKNLQTFKAKVKFLRKQIAPTLACVLNCFAQLDEKRELAEAFMWELWLLGEEKMNKAQRKVQDEHRSIFCVT